LIATGTPGQRQPFGGLQPAIDVGRVREGAFAIERKEGAEPGVPTFGRVEPVAHHVDGDRRPGRDLGCGRDGGEGGRA
jgi:hypothetical protein